MKFKISEKLVKERDGLSYNLANYALGIDYIAKRAFKGVRIIFRQNILDLNAEIIELSVIDPSLVEHKQDKVPIAVVKDDDNAVMIRPTLLDGSVRAARVIKKYANQRFVETDLLGRVFVGEKGQQIKLHQIINVKDGVLYLSKVLFTPSTLSLI